MRLSLVQKAIEAEGDEVAGDASIKQCPNIRPDCDRQGIVSIWRYG
jgi:hypothetical protein